MRIELIGKPKKKRYGAANQVFTFPTPNSDDPVWPSGDAKVVCCQVDCSTTCFGGFHLNFKMVGKSQSLGRFL